MKTTPVNLSPPVIILGEHTVSCRLHSRQRRGVGSINIGVFNTAFAPFLKSEPNACPCSVTALISSCAGAVSGAPQQQQSPANATSPTGPAPQGHGTPQFVNGLAAAVALPSLRYYLDNVRQTLNGLSPGGPFQELLDLFQVRGVKCSNMLKSSCGPHARTCVHTGFDGTGNF